MHTRRAAIILAVSAILLHSGQAATSSEPADPGRSVVVIQSGISSATAFESEDGLITAAHAVVSNPVYAIVGGKKVRLRLVAIDRNKDLALFEGGQTPGGPLPIADREPVLGEQVSAYGKGGPGKIRVKSGTISGVFIDVVETDAAGEKGDSGSPLVDKEGRVIGMVVASVDGEKLDVAVKGKVIQEFLRVARAKPDHLVAPWLMIGLTVVATGLAAVGMRRRWSSRAGSFLPMRQGIISSKPPPVRD